ncbi:cupin domain-containing protein [Sphaerisporangium rubeum]|uniref:Mannose-6-phosphate isomerase-like protein (Cupin superfamily) n=1 Tax=Sphaerisporangium rubeum TaxID=321317 RepID=A0A7X0M7H9_9ACTN|nr:cupin domain-containing protein [Sphaerisporangium rubeum]MBB6474560.1 mannose-6-phosphate isomerase-like protein (cupin superfamily) [Sphaerisporangium rubeum]
MSYPAALYFGERGLPTAGYRPAGQEPELRIGEGGTEVSYLATGATTGGLFGLYRWDMGSRPSGPSAHYHRTMAESFYVLTGTVRLFDGATWIDARPGDFLHVPPGGVHAFRNESGEPVSMLLHFAPGAPREGYFEELAEIAESGRTLTAEEWTELYRRHDQYMV